MENFLITDKPRKSIWVDRLKAEVAPRFLDGTQYNGTPTAKRDALAQWMINESNPYFSRALVNRIWKHFMGRAFVEPLDGFGTENLPTNPALLKWLANDFVIHGYNLQHLMRTILSSEAYQRTSETNESNKDDELYYSHAYVKPLSAEQFFFSCSKPLALKDSNSANWTGSHSEAAKPAEVCYERLRKESGSISESFCFSLITARWKRSKPLTELSRKH